MRSFAYLRISSTDQNEARQLIAMQNLNIPPERIFLDKLSGKNTARPALQKMLSILHKGDKVIVESVSRFARNTRDLLELIDKLSAKGVEFVSLKEKIDTTTPAGKFMLTVFGAVSELERDFILQRQAEGIAAARARGVHMGRPIKRPPENFGILAKQWARGKLRTMDFMKQTGLTETTLYRRLREHQIVRKK